MRRRDLLRASALGLGSTVATIAGCLSEEPPGDAPADDPGGTGTDEDPGSTSEGPSSAGVDSR